MDESKPDGSSAGHRGSPSHRGETHGRGEDIDPDTPISEVKGPNIFHRAKEEIEAIVDTINSKRESASPKKQSSLAAENRGSPRHHRETHGRGEDIDVDTPISEVKGPNIFHRAKEEIEAIVDTINSKRESASPKKQSSLADNSGSLSYRRETHGRGEDIDADTPISEFKGPNIFHRAKEEIEAIVDTIHSKRESASPKKQSSLAADRRGSPSRRRETHGRGEDIDADIPISEFKGPNIFHRAKEEIEAIVQSKRESDQDAASPKKDGFRASISKMINKTRNRD